MRLCSKCNIEKPLEDFYLKSGGSRRYGHCKKCHLRICSEWAKDNQASRNESSRRWSRNHPEKRKTITHAANLKRIISVDKYESLSVQQGGVCAICKTAPTTMRLAVDHDHRCCPGKRPCGECVRGLLCGNCNKGLGSFQDNPALLHEAASYLAARTIT